MRKMIMAFLMLLLIGGTCGCSLFNNTECEKCNNEKTETSTGDATVSAGRYKEFMRNIQATNDKRSNSNQEQIINVYNSKPELFGYPTVYVEITLDGQAVIKFEEDSVLGKKYPDGYKVPEKVWYAKEVFFGNGGMYDIVFITEEGYPLIINALGNEIEYKKAKNKNVVNIVEYSFISGPAGSSNYYVIDIDGNVEELEY